MPLAHYRHFPALLTALSAALAFVLAFSACGGRQAGAPADRQPLEDGAAPAGTLDAQGPQAMQAQTLALPSLARLDELAAGAQARLMPPAASAGPQQPRPGSAVSRAVSELQTFTMYGHQVLANSASVVVTEDSAVLNATGSTLAWAVYEARNAGLNCELLIPNISVVKPRMWIAKADYSTGRWLLLGPYAEGPPDTINLNAEKYLSPERRQYFAIICSDGGQAVVNSFEISIPEPTASLSTAVSSASGGIGLLDLAGRPGLVYKGISGELAFALGDSVNPAGPADWNGSVIDSSAFPQYYAATLHQGRVVVAYVDSLFNSLMIAEANTSQPVQDSDWDIAEIANDAVYEEVDICSNGQRVYIVAHEFDPADADMDDVCHYLRFTRSDSADARGVYSGYRLRPLGQDSSPTVMQPCMVIDDGRPLVAFQSNMPEDSQGIVMRSRDANPALSEWVESEMGSSFATEFINMAPFGDHPAVITNISSLFAMELFPQADDSVELSSSEIFADASDARPDIAVAYGRPYTVYQYFNGDEFDLTVQLFTGIDNLFSFNPNFSSRIYLSVPAGGPANMSLATIDGVRSLAYFDYGTSQVNYVRLTLPED